MIKQTVLIARIMKAIDTIQHSLQRRPLCVEKVGLKSFWQKLTKLLNEGCYIRSGRTYLDVMAFRFILDAFIYKQPLGQSSYVHGYGPAIVK